MLHSPSRPGIACQPATSPKILHCEHTPASEHPAFPDSSLSPIFPDKVRFFRTESDFFGLKCFRIESISSGTLQKWSGSAWVGVTAGSTLLGIGEKLRWKAAVNANGTLDAFTVKAWDGSLGSASAVQVKVQVSTVGHLLWGDGCGYGNTGIA